MSSWNYSERQEVLASSGLQSARLSGLWIELLYGATFVEIEREPIENHITANVVAYASLAQRAMGNIRQVLLDKGLDRFCVNRADSGFVYTALGKRAGVIDTNVQSDLLSNGYCWTLDGVRVHVPARYYSIPNSIFISESKSVAICHILSASQQDVVVAFEAIDFVQFCSSTVVGARTELFDGVISKTRDWLSGHDTLAGAITVSQLRLVIPALMCELAVRSAIGCSLVR